MERIFTKSIPEYKRLINPIKEYVKQAAYALSIQTGDSIEDCSNFIIGKIKNRSFKNMRDPEVLFLERDIETGDRRETSMPLSVYIKTIDEEDITTAPTGTCYLKPRVKKSHYVGFLQDNVDKRNVFKKIAYTAKAASDMVKFVINNNAQQVRKRFNNSLSGSFALKTLMTYNKSAHNTLTSTTRMITSIGNANAEKMNGNRHYFTPNIVVNDLISITADYDKVKFTEFMEINNIHYCTVDEVMLLIKKCSLPYIKSNKDTKRIKIIVESMSSINRSFFMYASDLHTLRIYNEEYVRTFLGELSSKKTDISKNPLKDVWKLNPSVLNLAHHICEKEIVGMGTDYEKMDKKGVLNTLVSTAIHSENVLIKYKEFIKILYMHNSLPSGIANIRNMVRDDTVLSDTDSTCFSLDKWVRWWFKGELRFTPEATGLSAAVMTMITQTTDHMIKILSANMNIDESMMDELKMKSEFFWPVFIRSNVSKHYFALVTINEGSVFKEPELELKGVHLFATTSSPEVRDKAHVMIKDICTSVLNKGSVDLKKYLKEVADVERSVINRIVSGDITVYKSGKVKQIEAYKDPNRSPYHHHNIWKEVFAPKYGHIPEPPYSTIKVNTTISNVTDLKKWLASIEDVEFRNRVIKYLKDTGKPTLGVMQLNKDYVLGKGIPEEIIPIIDKKKIAKDNGGVFYVILETLGFYRKKNKLLMEMGY